MIARALNTAVEYSGAERTLRKLLSGFARSFLLRLIRRTTKSGEHSGYLDCIGPWRMLAEGDIVICVPAAAGRGRCL